MDKRWEELFSLNGKTNIRSIKNILKKLNFTKNFEIINVVGTNGKGSSTKMIAQALKDSGKKVGVFTSPHLVLPNERIRVEDKNISDSEFFKIYEEFKGKHFFSSLFIVAMKYFQKQNIDIAVIEAGVGGMFDSTNAVNGDYGILTSIGLDHTKFLGKTHQKIFEDKIGIFNEGMKFYIPSELPKDIRFKENYHVIENNGQTYQIRNCKLVEGFLLENFNLTLTNVKFPRGRTENISINGHECIFDVAHNLDGIKATLEHLGYNNYHFDEVVISLGKRKDLAGVLELFNGKKIRFFKPDETFRSFDFEEIKNLREFVPKKKTLFIGSFKLIGMLYE